jgi:PKHD-type hydroxylase
MSYAFPTWHPPFDHVPLFSPEECAWLIQQAEDSQKFAQAQVMRQDGKVGSDDDHCNADIATYKVSSPVHAFVFERVRKEIHQLNRKFNYRLFAASDYSVMPYVSVMRYDTAKSAKFQPHVDMAGHPGVRHRKLSVVVPLNDPIEYAGGRLIIDTGEKFDAFTDVKVGDGVVFSSLSMHGVTPVTKGIRYSLVFFIQGPSFC